MTDTPMTWRDVQAERQDPIDAALAAWFRDIGPTMPTLRERMENAINAADEAQSLRRICDEPGCVADATCEWPVPQSDGGGYRSTCEGHRCKEYASRLYQAGIALAGLPQNGAS